MQPDGKIYIVVTVLAVILAGIAVYLFLMDRKIGKIEKEIKGKKEHKAG
jgi:CcmD family protein